MIALNWNFELLVGVSIGAVLLCTFVRVPAFGTLVLIGAASVILLVYLTEGSGGILRHASALRADAMVRLDFSKGLAIGMIAAGKLLFVLRSLRLR